jgi:hypothetical protein
VARRCRDGSGATARGTGRPEVVIPLVAGGGFALSFFAWISGYQVRAMVLLGASALYLLVPLCI